MEDRIRQFMEYKGISASDLAGMLEVQRSNVSHILNGRNQPGAGFIQKLKSVFRELDLNWLYNGEGDMLVGMASIGKAVEAPELPFMAEVRKVAVNESVSSAFPATGSTAQMPVQETLVRSELPRKLDKIVMFYSDKSFCEYHPE